MLPTGVGAAQEPPLTRGLPLSAAPAQEPHTSGVKAHNTSISPAAARGSSAGVALDDDDGTPGEDEDAESAVDIEDDPRDGDNPPSVITDAQIEDHAAAAHGTRGDGRESGDRVHPPSALKAKQRASKKDAAARFVELSEAQTKEKEDEGSARIVAACATADYQQGRVRVLEEFLRLEKAKGDTTKIVELTKANVTPEEYAKWMRIFSAGGPSDGPSG